MGAGEKTIVTNRPARRDYQVLDTVEAGIALQGTEVKTLRTTASVQFKDSYADIIAGEMYLVGVHISPYEQGNINNHKPERKRKLLLHKQQILKLGQRAAEKGLTLVPLRLYFKHGRVKVEVGVCRGKKTFEKRDTIKERESKREIERAMKTARGARK